MSPKPGAPGASPAAPRTPPSRTGLGWRGAGMAAVLASSGGSRSARPTAASPQATAEALIAAGREQLALEERRERERRSAARHDDILGAEARLLDAMMGI